MSAEPLIGLKIRDRAEGAHVGVNLDLTMAAVGVRCPPTGPISPSTASTWKGPWIPHRANRGT